MKAYILGTWYLQVKMEVKSEFTDAASERQALRYAYCLNHKLRHRRQTPWQKLQHLSASLLFKKAEIAGAFRHLWWKHAAYSLMNRRWLLWVLVCSVAEYESLGQVNIAMVMHVTARDVSVTRLQISKIMQHLSYKSSSQRQAFLFTARHLRADWRMLCYHFPGFRSMYNDISSGSHEAVMWR